MTAETIVESFQILAAQCLDALMTEYAGMEWSTVWTGNSLRPRDQTRPVRSGSLQGLGTFRLHGRGCQFELDSGADVDVVWDDAGRATFDSWRMLMYARSIGEEDVDRASLRIAASKDSALVQLEADEFTWARPRRGVVRT
jgi:hypothetical protein